MDRNRAAAWQSPPRASALTTMPNIALEWQRFEELSAELLYEVLRFRQSIFVVEQRSPYADLDGLDQEAWHLLLRSEGELAGYLRLIPMPIRIGRVAVAWQLRRRGLGRRLMEEALRVCRERCSAQDIILAAQLSIAPFYSSFGFAAISEPYDDFGVMHVEMALRSGR
jgi:ElaA protein